MEKRKSKGKQVKVLDNRPDVPAGYSGIWAIFMELNDSRQAGFSGGQSLSITDIKSYLDLMGFDCVRVTRRIFRWVTYLDRVYMDYYNSKRKKENK